MEKYWHIVRTQSKENCPHESWTPMLPLEEIPDHPTLTRYTIWLHEQCTDCGENRKRQIGFSSHGTG